MRRRKSGDTYPITLSQVLEMRYVSLDFCLLTVSNLSLENWRWSHLCLARRISYLSTWDQASIKLRLPLDSDKSMYRIARSSQYGPKHEQMCRETNKIGIAC